MTQKRGDLLRSLGMAFVLAIGLSFAWAVAVIWGAEILKSLHRNLNYDSMHVDDDGMVTVNRRTYAGNHSDIKIYSLDGNEVDFNQSNNALEAFLPTNHYGNGRIASRILRYGNNAWLTSWYFINDGLQDGRGYFVGYDRESKNCIGFIGRDGFRADQPPFEQWFPVDGTRMELGKSATNGYPQSTRMEFGNDCIPPDLIFLISGSKLVKVDLSSRKIAVIKQAANLVSVAIASGYSMKKEKGNYEQLALRTKDRVVLFGTNCKQRAEYIIPESLRSQDFHFYSLTAGKALVDVVNEQPDNSLQHELYWLDASGNIVRQSNVQSRTSYSRNLVMEAWSNSLAALAPAVAAVVALVAGPQDELFWGRSKSYSAALQQCCAVYWPPLLLLVLISIAMAWWSYRRHVRYGQPYPGVWFTFVLLFGLPGLVGYLYHRRWPVLEKCPACGQKVPRDRETCACCSEPFPAPERTGCEVFA